MINLYKENTVDEIVSGYKEAFLWTERPLADNSEDDADNTFEDLGYTVWDFSPDAENAIRETCRRFYRLVKRHKLFIPDWKQAGMDLYFTRQGHGVGFWSRPELYGKPNGEALTDLVDRNFSETYGWVSNNKIEVE